MDKTERLLRMMEHPEQYTDAQWQELLSDEECRELYETMRFSASAFEAEGAKEKIANGIKEEEWQKFIRSEEFFERSGKAERRVKSEALKKVAAAFIGLLMLCGIAYAAIHIAHQYQQTETLTPNDTTAVANSSLFTHHSSLPQDSTAQPRLYDNVPLGEILDELSTYYNIKVVYYTEEARHPRLFYQWKPEYTIEKVVEMLNNFEWLQMELENDTLYVKSTAIPANDC